MRLLNVNTEMTSVGREDFSVIEFTFNLEMERIFIKSEELIGEKYLQKVPYIKENGILAIIEKDDTIYYLHVNNYDLIITPYLNSLSPGSVNLKLESYHPRFTFREKDYSYVVSDILTGEEIIVDHLFFKIGHKELLIPDIRNADEPYIYMKISCVNHVSFLEYTIAKAGFSIKTVNHDFLVNDSGFQLSFKSANQFELTQNNIKNDIKISEITKTGKYELKGITGNKNGALTLFRINKRMFIIRNIDNRVYLETSSRSGLFFKKSVMKIQATSNSFVIEGRLDIRDSEFKPDTLITRKGKLLGQINWENSNKYKVIISKEILAGVSDIHNFIYFAFRGKKLYSLCYFNKNTSRKTVEAVLIEENQTFVVRVTAKRNIVLTMVQNNPIYNKNNKLKINLAYYLNKIIAPFRARVKTNLYFEKESMRACESARYVFARTQEKNIKTSKNYYILSENSIHFSEMNELYGKKIIKTHTFMHYFLIFSSTTFVTSELSPHIIAPRFYNDKLNKAITEKPFYFLNHGIMFGKPPSIVRFFKNETPLNIQKILISSDYEADAYYQRGYDDTDLMKTGMPNLDFAILEAGADKITYMPTYRNWEEGLVWLGQINETTYFNSIMTVIKTFENAGLLDRLLVTPHPKFANFITEHLPEYKDNICEVADEALKKSRIFITDYSSAIYDSTHRGAFPIFYWEDESYLIDKYKGVPHVTRENAPGLIADTPEELIKAVNYAIATDYKLTDDIVNKYRKINEFYDNNNTERVIEALYKDKVL